MAVPRVRRAGYSRRPTIRYRPGRGHARATRGIELARNDGGPDRAETAQEAEIVSVQFGLTGFATSFESACGGSTPPGAMKSSCISRTSIE
jgi:hypothetical protein